MDSSCSERCNQLITNWRVHILVMHSKNTWDIFKYYPSLNKVFKCLYYVAASWITLLKKWVWHTNIDCARWISCCNKRKRLHNSFISYECIMNVWSNAKTINQIFGYSVSMAIINSLIHYSIIHHHCSKLWWYGWSHLEAQVCEIIALVTFKLS